MKKCNWDIDDLVEIVTAVAKEELLPRFSKISVKKKMDGSLLTEADVAVQNKIRHRLEKLDSNILFLSEEMSEAEQEKQLRQYDKAVWILDPLDGTTNFAAGIPYYAISLALLEKAETILGIVYDPERDECFIAEKGKGARLLRKNEAPLRLGTENTSIALNDAVACIDLKRLPQLLAINLVTRHPFRSQRSFGGVALDWCWLAAGRFDVYLHGKQNIWDYAAGLLIYTESGGFSSDLDGAPVFINQLVPRSGVGAVSPGLFKEWIDWLQDAANIES